MSNKAFRPKPTHPAYDYWTLNRLLNNSVDDEETGCRVWQGRLNKPGGYGRIGYRHKQWRAHRLFYTLMIGAIPDGLELMHSCDNPRCINPNHLNPATHSENIADAYAKGRKTVGQGTAHPRFKFTEAQALEIRDSTESATSIAKRLGVSKSAVCRIRTGKTWASLNWRHQ